MGRAAVWYRRWGVSTDVIYMQLGATKNNVNVSFDQWLVQPVVEYKATDWLSPYAGARYLRIERFGSTVRWGERLRAHRNGGIP